MGTTVQVLRDVCNALISATDLVDSPDDNGYYFAQTDFQNLRRRTSKIYKTENAAMSAWRNRKVEWDEWYH